MSIRHHHKQTLENAKEMRCVLGLPGTHLKTGTFLEGEPVTLANIADVCILLGSKNGS